MDNFEQELKVGFLDEAAQSLADVEQCFLSLEANPNDSDNLNKIFRLAHNLKGSSKAVGFLEMGAFTHEFETFILKIKNGELAASAAVVTLLLNCNDHLVKMVETLKQDLSATFDSTKLLEEMQNLKEAATSQLETPEVDLQSEPEIPIDVIEEGRNDLSNEQVQKEIELLLGENIVPQKPHIEKTEQVQVVSSAKGANQVEETLRVSLTKLENLLNSIGEMVILQSVLREQANSSTSLTLKKTVNQLGKVSKEIQDLSMSLRMVPVKPTFQKMQRIVRDTAKALNKEVSIVLVGEETELDKTVLEKINDPLVHLIRNSVDHGIESQELRAANGKPAKGQVTLSAFHQSGKLVIEVKDDGGGLNPEKLKKKAIEKNIIKSSQQLTDREAYNLIFAPGFSTKEQVTDVSGRGVGMDVVRTNIQELSGEVHIDSELGKGSTFRIILPLTLAIIDGMTLTYGPDKFVIPLAHVHETLKPQKDQIQSIVGAHDVLILRGENLPIFKLGDFFNRASKVNISEMIALVIRSGPQPFAILVDDILGQYQVVVKQLGPEMQKFSGVSGATILGDGKPALILEPQDLLKRKLSKVPTSKSQDTLGGTAA